MRSPSLLHLALAVVTACLSCRSQPPAPSPAEPAHTVAPESGAPIEQPDTVAMDPSAPQQAVVVRLKQAVSDRADDTDPWQALDPLVADEGVFWAIDSVGLDDESTHRKASRWWRGEELARELPKALKRGVLIGEAVCKGHVCSVSAGHFSTELAFVEEDDGRVLLVGVFETDGLVAGERVEEIARARRTWLEELGLTDASP